MLLEKVINTIKRYKLVDKGDRIVIAVSGGPDSVTLLYLLNSLKKEMNLKLHIAHLDHCLRDDSFKDRRFVEQLVLRLGLPVTVSRVNVKRLAKKGSLEEVARNARLAFLSGVAKRIKADKIALGHTLDDQAETVLMRILRGTGLYGLAGIMPKRKISGCQIIRPLIEIRRKEIEAYLKRIKVRPRLDASNLQDLFLRNRIRNRLIPLLEKGYNPNIKEVLANMAQSLAADYDYLTLAALRMMKAKRTGPRIRLKRLLRLHPALQRLLLRWALARVKGDTRRISFQHIKEIEDLFLNRPFNSIVDLPGGISVAKKKNTLFFYRRNKQ